MNFMFAFFFLLVAPPCFAVPSLLSAKDLKKAPLMTSLEKPKDREGPVDVLWICTEKAKTTLKANCDETGNDELPADEREWARAVLEIRATTPIATYNYYLRHAVQVSECKKMLRSIRKVQKKNLPYCIIGYYLDEPKMGNGSPHVGATFYQLKSPLGYVIDMDF